MKFWNLAVVVLVLAGVAAVKSTNPSYELNDVYTFSGVPITTLHTPATP
ncbi:hypothetical protein [Roseibium salinum]|uniref:Uncharacterized protein n=1 Tax=Roseibium salinum TaxID=1604349 RepID=A0ABT3R6N4_9HYPH|nr:hypothetical protein [Roseibium sp. DSM 29163]MCX2724956.1 hypothetical protein [Roseibium sp. DSM 29163]MDN3721115.1 hypothetical protein [Roseibium salinum]